MEKNKSKNNHFEHVQRRTIGRFGINLKKKHIKKLQDQIKNGHAVFLCVTNNQKGEKADLYLVQYSGQYLPVIYTKPIIRTVLPYWSVLNEKENIDPSVYKRITFFNKQIYYK